MRRRGRFILVVSAALVVAAAGAAWRSVGAGTSPPGGGDDVPTTRVERGTLELAVHMNGDLRASQQQVIMAPTVGGAIRILTMANAGESVKKGDVVLEFDPADQLYALEQAQSELLEAEQEIIKRRANTEAQVAEDKVSLLTAQFDVRRAELDTAVDQDLIPANVYKVRQATLEEARRVLAQTEQDIKSRGTVNEAGLAVLLERRAKASVAADRARQNIESLVIKAPIDGVVALKDNSDAAGGVFFSGMTLPQYRVGDSVSPGRPVLDIFDISSMEIQAAVNEQERTNVEPMQTVRVQSSGVPGTELTAKVTAISGLGQPDENGGPLRTFKVTLKLDTADPRLRPGTSVKVVVLGQRLENVLLLPRQAVFEQDGKSVIYARSPTGFQVRPVKVLNRTESRVALDDVAEGTEVALVNPDTAAAPSPRGAASAGPGLGR